MASLLRQSCLPKLLLYMDLKRSKLAYYLESGTSVTRISPLSFSSRCNLQSVCMFTTAPFISVCIIYIARLLLNYSRQFKLFLILYGHSLSDIFSFTLPMVYEKRSKESTVFYRPFIQNLQAIQLPSLLHVIRVVPIRARCTL